MNAQPLLVVIAGPTASGKTALSLALAREFAGEIVSCDSVAVYRDFQIGTAKPTAEERRLARHHLLDVVNPDQVFTAGDYSRLARGALSEIAARSRLPIVAGGTGLYLRALLEGLFPGPARSEELRARLRDRAQEKGAAYMHRLLARLDPAAAAGIHANDLSKLVRALEVCLLSRKPMTEMWQRGRDPLQGFQILRLGLNPDREQLYARINQRAAAMFSSGLLEETRDLVSRYGAGIRPLQSLGYRQALAFLRGELTREQAIRDAQQGHRNYSKRQLTWFRREPGMHWIAGFGSDPAVQQRALDLVRSAVTVTPR